MIYHTMGDADQAIVDYSDAIRLTPNDVQPYVNRGIVLYTKKDNNEARSPTSTPPSRSIAAR